MATAAPSAIFLSPSRERDDYVRVARLIIRVGTTVLRALFDTYHPPADLANNLNNWKTHLETYARLTEHQKQILYPGSGDPITKNFDLSLLYKLLRNICGLTETACKWNECPSNGDISLQDDIVRIRNYRNEIYVLEDMSISSDKFQKYWKEISGALIRINNANPNKLDPRNLEEQMLKLKYDSITQDILNEIQETLNDHTEALGRLENQGDGLCKQMECLQDTVIQSVTAIQQSQAPKLDVPIDTTTKKDSNNYYSNNVINNNNYNTITNIINLSENTIRNDPKVLSDLCYLPISNQNAARELPALLRSQSFPTSSNLSQQSRTPHDQYERSLSLYSQDSDRLMATDGSSLSRDFEEVFLSDDGQANQSFDQQDKIEKKTECINFETPPWSEGHNEPSAIREYKKVYSYPGVERATGKEFTDVQPYHAQSSLPLKAVPLYHGNVFSLNEPPIKDRSNNSVPSPVFSTLNATAKPFEPKMFQSTNQSQSTYKTKQNFTQGCEPVDLSRSMQEGRGHSPLDDSTAFQLSYTDDGSRRRSSRFEENSESHTPQNGRILHINISICENRNPGRLHLGQLISQSLTGNQTDKQFRSYMMQSRQLKIAEVDYQDDIHSCIGVSADDLESLEDIWRDCVTNDLREIIKETVLPSDFDGKLEVSIDGKEYEQCCKRLKPKDLGEMPPCHSQSISFNQTQEEDVFSPRCQSLGELSSSSKRAFDELYLLLCKHGGKLHITEVMGRLSSNGRAEVEKAMTQKNMGERFRILPGNVIQARLNFCALSESECNSNCPNLHLCRYNILAGCTFPGNCKNSHDITDNHTNRIFRDANLSSLTEEERSNLLKNIAYTVPEICRFYNKGRNSTCTKKDQCTYLHVCMHWVKNDCLFNKPNQKCSRAHTFADPTTRNILKESNLYELSDDEIKEKLLKQNF